jgi:hypothetical protein
MPKTTTVPHVAKPQLSTATIEAIMRKPLIHGLWTAAVTGDESKFVAGLFTLVRRIQKQELRKLIRQETQEAKLNRCIRVD